MCIEFCWFKVDISFILYSWLVFCVLNILLIESNFFNNVGLCFFNNLIINGLFNILIFFLFILSILCILLIRWRFIWNGFVKYIWFGIILLLLCNLIGFVKYCFSWKISLLRIVFFDVLDFLLIFFDWIV